MRSVDLYIHIIYIYTCTLSLSLYIYIYICTHMRSCYGRREESVDLVGKPNDMDRYYNLSCQPALRPRNTVAFCMFVFGLGFC